MKILMSAYSCEPGQGSERGVGWNMVREVAQHHQVWVMTRPDESKAAIEAELKRNPIPNLHFVYFTLPFWQDSLRWGQSGAMQIHYYLWQIQAYFEARKLHRAINFDLSHHVTFVKYSNPSFLALLPIPFVWGPVGGGESAPKSFWTDFSRRARIYETARALVRRLGELDPFVRLTAKRSCAIAATTKDTADRLAQLGANKVEISTQLGLLDTEIDTLSGFPAEPALPLKFISMGRLLHWKGFYLGLRAFAQANLKDAEYWIVGDGGEREALEELASGLGIAERVKFCGELSRMEALAKLSQAHVLVHPSLHDSGAGVCMEAMAAGRPIICLDLGGPAIQVTDETGFKIPARSPEQAVSAMAEAMRELTSNSLRLSMGRSGQQRVRELYSWSAKGKQLAQAYQELVTQ